MVEVLGRLSDDAAAEPDGYMVATGTGGGLVPLAFRPSREAAEAELAGRWAAYPSASVYALHRVETGGGSRG